MIYNMFKGDGELLFNSLSPRQWADLMSRFNNWQKNGKESARKSLQKKIDEFEEKGSIDTSRGIKVNEKTELRRRRKARKDIKTETTKKIDSQTFEQVSEDAEITQEQASKAQVRWEMLAKDEKSRLQGEILYALHNNENADNLIAEYTALAGRGQTEGLINQINHLSFEVGSNVTPSIAKLQLLQQLVNKQSDGTLHHSLDASSSTSAHVVAVKTRIGELQAQRETTPDGPETVSIANRIVELQVYIQQLTDNAELAKKLPRVDSALLQDNDTVVDGAILSLAQVVIEGNTRGVDDNLDIDLGPVRETATVNDVKAAVQVYDHNTKEITKIIEAQNNLSAQMRVAGIGVDVFESLSPTQMNDMQSLVDKSQQLESKKEALREMQMDSARLIAAVHLGKTKVNGLKTELSNYRLTSRGDGKAVTKNTSKRVRKEIEYQKAEVEKWGKKIEELKEVYEKDPTNENLDKFQEARFEQSMALFALDGAQGAVDVQSKLGSMDLSGEIADINVEYSEADQKKLKKVSEKAAEVYAQVSEEIESLKVDTTSSQGYDQHLRNVPTDQLVDVVAQALLGLYKSNTSLTEDGSIETDGIDTQLTAAGFLGSIMNKLPIEDKKAAAYVASYLLGKLESMGVVETVDPLYHKDSAKIEILDVELMDDIIFGNAIKNMEAQEAKLKRQERLYSEPRFNGIEDWKTPNHPDGSKQLSKQQAQDKMSKADYPNTYKVQNTAKAVKLKANREVIKVYKQMLLAQHPAFMHTNKNYTKDQRAGKQREIRAITEKGDKIGTRAYQSNYKFGSRGRIYSTVSYFNHQAAKEANAAITLGTTQEIGPAGWKWLLADVAENAGVQAETLQDLTNGTLEQLDEWMKWANDPVKYADQIFGDSTGQGGMDAPPLFLASILELKKVLQHAQKYGDVTTYQSNYVPYIDATVSGPQNIGSLLKSRQVMQWVNGLPGVEKQDLYSEVFASLIDSGTIITDDNATTEQMEFFNRTRDRLDAFDKQLKQATKEMGEAKRKIIEGIRKRNPEPKFPKGTPKPVVLKAKLDWRKDVAEKTKNALVKYREQSQKYTIQNPDYGKKGDDRKL